MSRVSKLCAERRGEFGEMRAQSRPGRPARKAPPGLPFASSFPSSPHLALAPGLDHLVRAPSLELIKAHLPQAPAPASGGAGGAGGGSGICIFLKFEQAPEGMPLEPLLGAMCGVERRPELPARPCGVTLSIPLPLSQPHCPVCKMGSSSDLTERWEN